MLKLIKALKEIIWSVYDTLSLTIMMRLLIQIICLHLIYIIISK